MHPVGCYRKDNGRSRILGQVRDEIAKRDVAEQAEQRQDDELPKTRMGLTV
jgi:hypothetical protein